MSLYFGRNTECVHHCTVLASECLLSSWNTLSYFSPVTDATPSWSAAKEHKIYTQLVKQSVDFSYDVSDPS